MISPLLESRLRNNIMRLIIFLLLSISCVAPFSVSAQDRIASAKAGPRGDQFRVIVAFITPNADEYRMQSLIIDVDPVKKKESPTSYVADLTTTTRNLATGEKKQRILVLRWEKSGPIEVKCDGGKWSKLGNGLELEKIVELVKTVVQNAPVETKDLVDFSLPSKIEADVLSVLNGIETSGIKCVRSGN